MLAFFYDRFSDLISDILPFPFSVGILGFLILPWILFFYQKIPLKFRSFLRFYFIGCISLIFLFSLQGYYPFGGHGRHSSLIMPGILMSCLIMVNIVLESIHQKRVRDILAIILVIILLAGLYQGKDSLTRYKKTYKELMAKVELFHPESLPESMISDRMGRYMFSWWMLPIEHHFISDSEGIQVYEYGQLKLMECRSHKIVPLVTHRLSQNKETHLFLSSFGYNKESQQAIHDQIRKIADSYSQFSFASQFISLRHGIIMISISYRSKSTE